MVSEPGARRQPVHPDTPIEQVKRESEPRLTNLPAQEAAETTAREGAIAADEVLKAADEQTKHAAQVVGKSPAERRCDEVEEVAPKPVVCTAFIALQDIIPAMGPTVLWAGTHTSSAHTRWYDERATFLRHSPVRVGLLQRGDLLLFDSRLLHCGGANDEQHGGRRALFYFSFKARDARGVAPGTLRGALRGCHHLHTLGNELA